MTFMSVRFSLTPDSVCYPYYGHCSMTAENNRVGAREPRMHIYLLLAYKHRQACAPPFTDVLLPDPFMLLGSPHTHPTLEWTLTQPCACRDSSPLPPITPADYFHLPGLLASLGLCLFLLLPKPKFCLLLGEGEKRKEIVKKKKNSNKIRTQAPLKSGALISTTEL